MLASSLLPSPLLFLSFASKDIYIYFSSTSFACVLHTHVSWYPQKSDESIRPLELDLELTGSHHVGAEELSPLRD